jgi:hypothetical protein
LLKTLKNKKKNKFIVSERQYIGIIATSNGFRSTLASCEAVQALAWAGYDSQWPQAAFNVEGYEVEVPITLPYSRKVKTHPYSGTPRSRCICYW